MPPYVEIYRNLKKLYDAVTSTPAQILSGVRSIIEDNAMGAGYVTRTALEDALRTAMAAVRADSPAVTSRAPAD